ncbi:MAG: N-acetyltransferase [Verrucomicrobiota bacterium]
MLAIRPEQPGDIPAIRRVNELAFGRPGEADLVDALRDLTRPFISLVAVEGAEIVGHILFTPVTVENANGSFTALSLAPVAVLPSHQRRGIGTELVKAGLAMCQQARHQIIFVVGHPEFYPRFGFAPAHDHGIACEFEVPPEAFLVCELSPGALASRRGAVKYPPPFHAL